MDKWKIEIELMSEAIFGSGQAVPGYLDLDILHDEYGIPYFKGKTFKGKLREELQAVADNIKAFNPHCDLIEYINSMFGLKENFEKKFNDEKYKNDGCIKFSDCTMDTKIIECLIYGLEKGMFSKEEVLKAFTEIRSFTSIADDGIAKEASLRTFRIVNRGLKLYCDLFFERELEEVEKELLAAGVAALKHLGAMESRGKGLVKCSLLCNDKDVTKEYLDAFERRVRQDG